MIRTLARMFATLLLAGPVVATEPVPAMGTPRPLTLPAKREFRLENGLGVSFVPFGTVPKATLVLTIATGAVADGEHEGLADVVAQLLKHGAGALDTDGLARRAAEMGGGLDASSGTEQMSVSMDVLGERASDAIAMIADVVRRPHLPAADLPAIKASMKRGVAIARSQSQGIAGEAFAKLMWGDTVYGRSLPSDAGLDALTPADVRYFVANEFGADRAHLYVAGRFDEAAVERALRSSFADWAAGPAPRHTQPVQSTAHVVRLIDRPGAKQSTIVLGRAVPGPTVPGFMALSVANSLYGGTPLLSRLDQNLREEKGWTYGVSSHLNPYRAISGWVVSADINTDDTAGALGEIYRELDVLRAVPAPAAELGRVQNYKAGNFLIGASSRQGLLGQLAFLAQQDLTDDWLTHYVEHVAAVTPEQAQAAAAHELDPRQMVLVIVGDLAKIKPGVLAVPALKDAEFR
jgi:predicted Zn-dependent peptidase